MTVIAAEVAMLRERARRFPYFTAWGPSNDDHVWALLDDALKLLDRAAQDRTVAQLLDLQAKADKYDAINTPEIADFLKAVENEALHQRERWPADQDAGKTEADWFWLVGYLAGKALHKPEKRLHHIITTAAACLNWHAHALGVHTRMRAGIEPPKEA